QKQVISPSRPRNNSALGPGCHVSRPSAVSSGKPSHHFSVRASGWPTSAAIASSSDRSGSARSRPGPQKKGSGGNALLPRKDGVRGLAVQCRKAGAGELVNWMPPAFANRFGAADDREIEREMGENVAHRPNTRWKRLLRLRPLAAGQSRHAAEQASGRTADQPHAAVAFDPIGEPMLVRALPALLRRG